jgi:hypothetical protein
MYKWVIMAASCLAFSAVSAQEEATDPISSSDEVIVDEGSGGDLSQPPSLFDCGCKGKGKPK